jgi:membrane protease YdiL (CAAX protease family)
MLINLFLDSDRRLRNGWWILIFFFVLFSLLFPLLLLVSPKVSLVRQAGVVAAASAICQLLRRRPMSELVGALDWRWPKQLLLGGLLGTLLMLVPALFLRALGFVTWQWNDTSLAIFSSALALYAAVAVAEEFVFRGFVFQRLLDGIGEWPAQLILAAYFVLVHSAALSAGGQQRYLAGLNIFLASLVFGLAFIRTRSLAMPLGIHFAANYMQGTILGFGVSGHEEAGMLRPVFGNYPDWLTGGAFGLEASLPGLVCVIVAGVLLYRWTPSHLEGQRDLDGVGCDHGDVSAQSSGMGLRDSES